MIFLGLVALSESLKEAFLCKEDSDVTITVGDCKFPAHSFILRHRSPVMKSMLTHDVMRRNRGVVNITDCDSRIFHVFLFYMYTGKLCNISRKDVFQLYDMADKYNMEELKKDCVDFILENLNADIICEVMVLATRRSDRSMLAHATKFFVDNAKNIISTPNWQEFMIENPLVANKLIIKAFNNDEKK